jgi:hypothetical protein
MIPLALAIELKRAGLLWRTTMHDFFAIPERGLDDRVYVLADMMAYTDLVQGWPVVAFHGTAEWALDYIFTTEVVWLPTEEQLREQLVDALQRSGDGDALELRRTAGGYRCAIDFGGETLVFEAATAGEAYGRALLHVLTQADSDAT